MLIVDDGTPIPDPAALGPRANEARRATQAAVSGFVLGLLLALAGRRARRPR